MFNRIKDFYASLGRPVPCNPFRRKVNVVYTAHWLNGVYMFTFKAGERDIRMKLIDHMIGNMDDEYNAKAFDAARLDPGIKIVDIF
jgi:hypothetical protein